MTAVIIIAIVLILFAAVFLLPVSLLVNFKEDFSLKVKFLGLSLYSSEKGAKEKNTKKEAVSNKEKDEPEKQKGFFANLKRKYGFSGAVREVLSFLKDLIPHIKGFLTHIKFRKVALNVSIASADAATTAIEYGAVCAAVYPFLALLESMGDVKYKAIDVKSDFESTKSDFNFSATIKFNILSLILAFFKIYSEYKKFIVRIETDERK